MSADREILFCSDFPIGYHNPEAEQKMSHFAALGYRVHYVEALGIRNPGLRHAGRIGRALLHGSDPGNREHAFDVHSPKLLPPRRAPLVSAFNRAWLQRQLLSALDDPGRAIAWLRYPTPELVDVLDEIDPALVIYESVDDHTLSPGLGRLRALVERTERRLLDRAGLVFAWSQPIQERLAAHHRNVVAAPPALDLEHFSRAAEVGEPEPRLAAYTGSIDFRFDAELVAAVARQLGDWRFVLTGPSAPELREGLSRVANVELAGAREASEIPGILGRASVCLMPYRHDSFTDTLFPIKLVEYLAAGRPVVSTPLAAVREFSEVVTVAEGAQRFAEAIESAAANDSPEARARRVARAQPYSWPRRIDEMRDAIDRELDG